jgi:acyl dehydratase
MEEVVDKGEGKGALLYMSRKVHDQFSGEPVFTTTQTLFCRADGGFSGSVNQARPVHALPNRDPDKTVELPTISQAALIYRLSGDTNPIHIDPHAAKTAGFPRPILHGLCSFGVAGHALLRAVANYRPESLRSINLRFSAPVFPGETICTEIWEEGSSRFSFRCRVKERNIVVINNGFATLH